MSDELDPLLDEDIDDLIPKKKVVGLDDEDDIFGDDVVLEEEDPFMTDLGYGFGSEEEEGF
jgi:hypothetical protein